MQLILRMTGLPIKSASGKGSEVSEKVPNSSFPDPLIKSEGMPPIAVEGMLDRGIQYSLKSKTPGFPLTTRGNDNNNPWIPAYYTRE